MGVPTIESQTRYVILELGVTQLPLYIEVYFQPDYYVYY